MLDNAPHNPATEMAAEFLTEMLEGAQVTLGHALDHIALGDRAGLAHAMRKFGSFTKAALQTLPDALGADRGSA